MISRALDSGVGIWNIHSFTSQVQLIHDLSFDSAQVDVHYKLRDPSTIILAHNCSKQQSRFVLVNLSTVKGNPCMQSTRCSLRP
jgi:hypothetical protein